MNPRYSSMKVARSVASRVGALASTVAQAASLEALYFFSSAMVAAVGVAHCLTAPRFPGGEGAKPTLHLHVPPGKVGVQTPCPLQSPTLLQVGAGGPGGGLPRACGESISTLSSTCGHTVWSVSAAGRPSC